MFDSLTLEKYAEVLFWGFRMAKKKPIEPSALVMVRYDHAALPLAEAMVRLLHEEHCIPIPRAMPSVSMEHDFYALANNKRLTYEIPGTKELAKALNGTVSLLAPESLTHLSDIDPELISMVRKSRQPIQNILNGREDSGDYAWTLGVYPTQAAAEHAGISLEEYARCIEKSCFLERGTPVNDWALFYRNALEVKKWLNSLDIHTLRLQSDHCDLLLRLGEQRQWVGVTGRNIPSFEIYTSPDWRGTEGVFFADQPSFRSGNIVRNARLEFVRGNVVKSDADEGETFLRDQIRMDSGSSRVGEFSLTDKRFSPIDRFMANTLYDENYGGEHGNSHIALGQSYSNAYDGDPTMLAGELRGKLGLNTSALHWDLVNTEPKHVVATLKSGKKTVIYEDGMFTY